MAGKFFCTSCGVVGWPRSNVARWIVALTLTLAVGAPASAQDPVDAALKRYRRQNVSLVEDALFEKTQKTTRVIYARRIQLGEYAYLFCGEALFGSQRQTFTLNSQTEETRVGAKPAALTHMGCYRPGGLVLIDLR